MPQVRLAGEDDPLHIDVGVVPEQSPALQRLLGDRREALVADLGRRFLEPGLRRLQIGHRSLGCDRVAGVDQPRGQALCKRTPTVLPAGQLGLRFFANHGHLCGQRCVRGL